MAPKLGYWNIRGIAQPIRLMLMYAEEPFDEKKYAYGPAPDFDRTDWLKEKLRLDLDFPNLPYYIDGDLKLTQSIAIMRYLARKLKLEPVTEEDKIRADMVEQQTADIRLNMTRICYSPDFETLKEDYFKTLPLQLECFSKYLGERQWYASQEKPTYVDFMVYETLDQHKYLNAKCLDVFQNLKDYCDRFEAIPQIHSYMKSPFFLKYPINGDMATFGARPIKKK